MIVWNKKIKNNNNNIEDEMLKICGDNSHYSYEDEH